MATDERVVWTGRPAMFRNAPVGFLLALLLVPLGIGLVILLIWWLRCLATRWTVTTRRTIARQGLLSKSTTELRHADIRAIHVEQGFFQRLMGTGTVRLSSASSDDYEIQMAGVANPEQVAATLRGLRERRDLPERPMSPAPAPAGATFAYSPFAASQVQPNVPVTAQTVGAAIAGQPSGEGFRKVGKVVAQVGTQAGPWTVATANRAWTLIRATPKKIDGLLKSTAGEGNDLIYRFFQAAAIGVSALAAFVLLALLWLTSWLWLSVPCLIVLIGLVLLFVGGKSVERGRVAGGGIAGIGLVMVVLGVPSTGLYLSNSIAMQRQDREARQANEEVASLVKTAQESFDRGDVDKAETELQRVPLVVKATDTKAAGLLQEKIRGARQEAAIRKANQDVSELATQAEMDFSSGRLEAAEEKLSKALSVPLATDTAKAKDLLARVPARRQELANERVTKLIAEAKDTLRASQYDKAMQIINEAILVKDATNTEEAEQILGKTGNAQPELLLRDAQQAIEQGKYSVAAKRLKACEAHPRSEKKTEATQMLRLLELVLNASKAQASLKSMSDGQINSLSESGKLPDDFTTNDVALREAVKVVFVRSLPEERNRRQAELAERKRQQEARLAQEAAQAKAEVERKRRAQAEEEAARKARRKAEVERKRRAQAEEEAARKAEEEYDANGLVLMRKSVQGKVGELGGEITGIVVNRRSRKLDYAQITFNLYDESGAQVGSAIGNINGLEPGGTWKFKATSLGVRFVKYKFSELSGF